MAANSLNAVTVGTYVDGNGQVQKSYQTIGRAFESKTGWVVRLNALPLTSMNDKGVMETVILLMPPKEKDTQQQAPARASRGGGYAAPDPDQEIPFIMEWR